MGGASDGGINYSFFSIPRGKDSCQFAALNKARNPQAEAIVFNPILEAKTFALNRWIQASTVLLQTDVLLD